VEPVEGGGGSAAAQAARRAAEEAARRAAEEARRQAAEESRREAARRRLIELNQADGYETPPPAGPFSTPTPRETPPVTSSVPTYSPEAAARLAATPGTSAGTGPDTPAANTFVSPQDQEALAQLAFRMEEHGATPEQVQRGVAHLRLSQIERDERLLGSVDGAALEQQGRELETSAQAAVDHYIKNLDSIYSGLAPVDREQAGYLAYMQAAQAASATYEGVAVQTRVAGLELEQAVLERQLAVEDGASPAALAAFDARIAEARRLLDGDPEAAARIQDLEHRILMLDKNAELYDPNRPADWRAEYERERAELQSQVEALERQRPENALLARLGAAQAAYDASSERLATQEGELQAALADYRAGIDAAVPLAQAGLQEFRQNVDLAAASPELDQAVRDLEALLPTATPEELGAALQRIESLPGGDVVMFRLQGADGILAADPRLRVLSGREIGVPRGLERFAEELIVNTALLGLPSYLENQRILNAPGASPALLGEARFGLALDYVGFALTIAGPVLEGVSAVARGGRTVLELAPEIRASLRAAGYADEAIEQIALRLNEAVTSSRALSNLMLRSSPEEASELIGIIRETLPLETYAVRRVPGYAVAVRQLAERPMEVVDFLVRADAATVEAFHALLQQGRSLDEARTILTLARNGRSVDEVTRALAAGRTLDELVAETFFVRVSAGQAHDFSGIPERFLSGHSIEDIAALAREEGVDILVRDANRALEETMAGRWPKDPHATFTVGGTANIKVASEPQLTAELGWVRFKTDSTARVGLEVRDAAGQWVAQDRFVVHTPEGWRLVPGADLTGMPQDWWAMGGDIDLLAVLERGGGGYRLQPAYSNAANELRGELNQIATVPSDLPAESVPGLFMHGPSLPFFNTNRGWTPALVFSSEGEMIRLAGDDAVEYWFKMRGVVSEPYAQYSAALGWLASRPIPFSSAGYLAGTTVGTLPEALSALPDLAGPTRTPSSPSTPTATPTP
jgi:hypothetical protein